MSKKELFFGQDKRFRTRQENLPGPGEYKDQNKWNQRTYNLQFISQQASPSHDPSKKSSLFMRNLGIHRTVGLSNQHSMMVSPP
jgi:ribosomal protein L35